MKFLKQASSGKKETRIVRPKTAKPPKVEVKWRNDGKAPAFLRQPSTGKPTAKKSSSRSTKKR